MTAAFSVPPPAAPAPSPPEVQVLPPQQAGSAFAAAGLSSSAAGPSSAACATAADAPPMVLTAMSSIDGGKAKVTLTNPLGQAQGDLDKVMAKRLNARASKYSGGHALTNPEKLTAASFGLTMAELKEDEDDDDDFEIDEAMPDEQDRLPEDEW